MTRTARIGIIGDFDSNSPSHRATNDALNHSAGYLSAKVKVVWLPTAAVLTEKGQQQLAQFDGLWAAPGSPYQSLDGALRGIQLARGINRPFLGT